MKKGDLEARILVLATLALVAFGLVMVYSATSAQAAIGGHDPMYYLKRQGAYAVVGLVLLVCASRVDFRVLRRLAPMLVLTSLGLCLAVLVLGTSVNGARRWLSVGPVAFQPSELAKLSLGVWAAVYLARRGAPKTMRELVRPVGILVGLFCILLLAEPDLGTSITLLLMLAAMLAVAGTPLRTLGLAGAVVSLVTLVAVWFEPYRRARIFSFLHPWHDAQGAGYQAVQAMIGLGSGGIFGVGIGQGVMKQSYLPEAHTDMILAVIGEELGLIGVTALIAAFALFAWAGLRVALRCRDRFGKTLAVGIVTLVCAQAAVNLAAVLGLAPLTGIPLPFVSYGGSNLVITLIGVGILLNIAVGGREQEARVRDRGRRDGRPRASGARSWRSSAQARGAREHRRVAGSRRSAAGA
jgi:cell division protein FtsW